MANIHRRTLILWILLALVAALIVIGVLRAQGITLFGQKLELNHAHVETDASITIKGPNTDAVLEDADPAAQQSVITIQNRAIRIPNNLALIVGEDNTGTKTVIRIDHGANPGISYVPPELRWDLVGSVRAMGGYLEATGSDSDAVRIGLKDGSPFYVRAARPDACSTGARMGEMCTSDTSCGRCRTTTACPTGSECMEPEFCYEGFCHRQFGCTVDGDCNTGAGETCTPGTCSETFVRFGGGDLGFHSIQPINRVELEGGSGLFDFRVSSTARPGAAFQKVIETKDWIDSSNTLRRYISGREEMPFDPNLVTRGLYVGPIDAAYPVNIIASGGVNAAQDGVYGGSLFADAAVRPGIAATTSLPECNLVERGNIRNYETAEGDQLACYCNEAGNWVELNTNQGASVTGVWKFQRSTTGAPSSGQVKYNNAVPASVTEVWIHEVTEDGTNVGGLLAGLQAGDALSLIQQDNTNNRQGYAATAQPTDNGTWQTIPVTFLDSSGTRPEDDKETSVFLLYALKGTRVCP